MKKRNINNFIFILAIITLTVIFLSACTSKKVKDNNYSTSFEGLQNEDVAVPEEFVCEVTSYGENVINIYMSKPVFEKLYDERVIRDSEISKGETPGEGYTYEVELRLKKGDETLYTMIVNKNGSSFTAAKKNEAGELIRIKTGEKSGSWIEYKKIIDLQWTTPGLVDMVEQCDNYEAYWYDKSTGEITQLHKEGKNTLSETFPVESIPGPNAMEFNITYSDDNKAFLKIRGNNLGLNTPALVLLGEDESKYILIKKVTEEEVFEEAETAEYFYQKGYFEEDYAYTKVSYLVEFGYVHYDENNKRTFEPFITESGKTYYTAVEGLSRGTFNMYVKRENIRDFLGESKDYSVIKGYIGKDFSELVYVVTN